MALKLLQKICGARAVDRQVHDVVRFDVPLTEIVDEAAADAQSGLVARAASEGVAEDDGSDGAHRSGGGGNAAPERDVYRRPCFAAGECGPDVKESDVAHAMRQVVFGASRERLEERLPQVRFVFRERVANPHVRFVGSMDEWHWVRF